MSARLLVAEGESLPERAAAEVATALREGELIIFPTDTLYALGGLAVEPRASRAVREVKHRPSDKPLPVVAADAEQIRALCVDWEERAADLAAAFWPGPLTLVLPARPELPTELTAGGASLAVRVPGRWLTRELCRLAGPLIATSANTSGSIAPSTHAEALAAVGSGARFAIDGGPGTDRPSTVVELLEPGQPRLLRAGALPWDRVQQCLASGLQARRHLRRS